MKFLELKYKTGEKGIKLIKYFESLHDGDLSIIGLQPKMDCSDIWTEGWGHAIYYKGKLLKGKSNKKLAYKIAKIKNPYMEDTEEADLLFMEDLKIRENLVASKLKVNLYSEQFDALVSHVYNCGISDTLFKLINTEDLKSERLKVWWTTKYITSGGVIQNGLVKRRQVEYELFSTAFLNL